MAGLSQKGTGKRPARNRRSPRRREHDPSLTPGTTHNDLGLGAKPADPDAPITWRFRIFRLNSPRRSGVSRCTTYLDANDAAADILGEYFELSGTPPEGRKVFSIDVVGEGPNAGQTGGAEGRDWT